MVYINNDKYNKKLFKDLKINCEKCFGYCCVALYFSAFEGFPIDKVAGEPCINLKSDFSCSIHKDLRKRGLKGCTSYDCFGAGQKVAQVTFDGRDWRKSPKLASQMFDVFLIMRQLHEMLWYLTQASILEVSDSIREEINLMIIETEEMTNLTPESILNLDIINHRTKVNVLLRKTSDLIQNKFKSKNNKKFKPGSDFIGKNLRKTNLVGADLRGGFLIAADLRENDLSGANLIGSDMRDADVRGANLENSIFITQSQINSAKGNSSTKLPQILDRPSYWEK
jgi:uncharacterized protein YjbI with pentapeptide repeats